MTDEQKARLSTKRPLTKEEYEARQSIIRRVVDHESGRTRSVEHAPSFYLGGPLLADRDNVSCRSKITGLH